MLFCGGYLERIVRSTQERSGDRLVLRFLHHQSSCTRTHVHHVFSLYTCMCARTQVPRGRTHEQKRAQGDLQRLENQENAPRRQIGVHMCAVGRNILCERYGWRRINAELKRARTPQLGRTQSLKGDLFATTAPGPNNPPTEAVVSFFFVCRSTPHTRTRCAADVSLWSPRC